MVQRIPGQDLNVALARVVEVREHACDGAGGAIDAGVEADGGVEDVALEVFELGGGAEGGVAVGAEGEMGDGGVVGVFLCTSLELELVVGDGWGVRTDPNILSAVADWDGMYE
jgi:hypothetical protein